MSNFLSLSELFDSADNTTDEIKISKSWQDPMNSNRDSNIESSAGTTFNKTFHV